MEALIVSETAAQGEKVLLMMLMISYYDLLRFVVSTEY